ncbi:hypothetical protein [Streptomyces sp. NBC_00073]|uniref:hypothetical protein n=1 Tax=Streptomyces sp. NBC_00073 TaxID=2975640 RepID=UPI00324C58C5
MNRRSDRVVRIHLFVFTALDDHRTSTKASAKARVRDQYTDVKADTQQVTAAESGHPTTTH